VHPQAYNYVSVQLHDHVHTYRESEQRFITVLYNDEVHSYDDVIGALTRTDVGMDQMGAVTMASNVDSMVSLSYKLSEFRKQNFH